MDNEIKNILHYVLNNYPYPSDLTKTRITKIVYLVDWYSCISNQKQITNISWYFDHYGPYVSDVLDVADDDPDVRIKASQSAYGGVKYIIESKDDKPLSFDLDSEKINIIDDVIEQTKNLSWNKFIDFVYSTYPIETQKKYGNLDLVKLAKETKRP